MVFPQWFAFLRMPVTHSIESVFAPSSRLIRQARSPRRRGGGGKMMHVRHTRGFRVASRGQPARGVVGEKQEKKQELHVDRRNS